MQRQRFGTFVGGLDLPDEKHATADQPIEPVAKPHLLRVPADPCRLGGEEILVSEGQRVSRGDRIAIAGGVMPIFAPADGVVSGFSVCSLSGRTALTSAESESYNSPSIEMAQLAPRAEPDGPEAVFDWRSASPDELLGRITEGGLTTCDAPLRPLDQWCRRAAASAVDVIIINGLENEPYLTGDHRLMVSHGTDIVTAGAILSRLLGADRTALAVDARRTDEYRQMAVSSESLSVQTLAVEHKYPMGNDIMLTSILTGRVPQPGGSPMSVGVAVVNIAACVALYQWVVAGVPPTERVVTVTGRHVRRAGNYLIPFGMPVEHVLNAAGASLEGNFCHGGPMTGVALNRDGVVAGATSALLSLGEPDERPASACIRCAWCTDHCPVRLDVANLNDMFELRQLDRAKRYDVTACLGCGVCSYVCPARLPLTHRVQSLKCIAMGTRHQTSAADG